MVVPLLHLILHKEDIVRLLNRSRMPIAVEVEAVAGNLLLGVGESRVKTTQQGIHRIERNLPNAEEAQDVVDTIGIEILGHLHEASLPPRIAIFGHLRPIVGREAPILAHHREIIGRSTRRRVHIE